MVAAIERAAHPAPILPDQPDHAAPTDALARNASRDLIFKVAEERWNT